MKIGFIGVGNMGGPMCRNIIKNTNHDVSVFDLDPDRVAACVALGASAAASVAALAAGCDVIITSLATPDIVERVALGAGVFRPTHGRVRPISIFRPIPLPPPNACSPGWRPPAWRCWKPRFPAA